MIKPKAGPEIWQLDPHDQHRHALSVDGRVVYVGSLEACEARFKLLQPVPDRERQDQMLDRAIGA